MEPPKVTVEISTKNRYDVLSNCLQSIVLQTHKPHRVIIFDDSDNPIDLRQECRYSNLFRMMELKGILWQVTFGQRIGQVANHQKALEMADTEWIWRCFRGDEKVETIKGIVKIRDIEVNDLVKTHLNRWKKVIKTYRHEYAQKKPFIKIETRNSSIRCTPEHPFLVRTVNGDKWLPAEEIKPDSVLLYPNEPKKDQLKFDCYGRGGRIGKRKHEYFGDMEIDADMARFLGLYLAEGCGGHDSIRFTFNKNEKEYIEFITSICKDRFGRSPTIHERWACCVKLNIKSFSKRFTEWFGNDATNKRVPDFVFSWSLINRLSFLRGYFEGDGWDNSKMCCFGTSSLELYDGIKKLAISCGLDCSEKCVSPAKKSRISGRDVFTKESYKGSMSSSAHGKMFDLLEAKQNGIYLEVIVKSVEHKRMTSSLVDPYVYNLEVEDDNSYIVGPAIVHNCDDDNIVEPNVLQRLIRHTLNDKVGAVASCVLHPGAKFHPNSTSGKIEDCNFKYAVQFAEFNGIKSVDHLYSTFLYRKSAAKHGYEKGLSRIGHREETLFSYQIKRAGWDLIVDGGAISWHFQAPKGGIRDFSDGSMWGNDQKLFEDKMASWGVNFTKYKFVYLDNGIGDHYAFKHILKDLKAKYHDHKIIISPCYPEVFEDEEGIELIDLNSGKIIGRDLIENLNVYKFCFDNKWENKNLVEAFRKMYDC